MDEEGGVSVEVRDERRRWPNTGQRGGPSQKFTNTFYTTATQKANIQLIKVNFALGISEPASTRHY